MSATAPAMSPADTLPDMEKFRLRRFVEKLAEIGEIERHPERVALTELGPIIEASPKATLFERAGAEEFQIAAAISGGRARLAAAFGVGPREVAQEYIRRLGQPQKIVEVPSAQAPVHQMVQLGEEVDLTTLPFYVQHEFGGGAYISSAIDYSVDPETGRTNVGCRRLMLRNRRELQSNLTDASDLKNCYLRCLKRGERFPVSFAIGSHPLDFLAASSKYPVDEFGLVGTLRGEAVPMVRGLTNGVLAPADAEVIVEGYFDELGYREMEGPYGEFYGTYGPMHINPVFHVTAITRRRDAIYQSLLHSGRKLGRSDSANLGALHAEVAAWRALRAARIEPASVFSLPQTNGRMHVRVALHNPPPGEARAAMQALFALRHVKHVFVVDDDVDVFDNEEMEWAMATRFRADRDLALAEKLPGFYMDPTMDEDGTLTKAGFDLTLPRGLPDTVDRRRARAATITRSGRNIDVRTALAGGPLYFAALVEAVGSDDGRDVALALDEMRQLGILTRLPDGEWALQPGG